MKATSSIRPLGGRGRLCAGRADCRRSLSAFAAALTLATVLLTFASCTRDDVPHDPKDTVGGTSNGTTAQTTPSGNGGGMGTMPGSPLDPDAGTVNPDGNAGDPPAGTGESRSYRSPFMH